MFRPKLTGSIDACVPQGPPPRVQTFPGRRIPASITTTDHAVTDGHAFQTFAR